MKPSSPGIWRLHGWVLALPLLSVLSPGWLAAQAPPGELPPASNRNPPPVRPQPTTATGAQTPQPTTTAGVQTPVPNVLLNTAYGSVTLGQPLEAASMINRLQGLSKALGYPVILSDGIVSGISESGM